MKKLLTAFVLLPCFAYAQAPKQYPNISGDVLTQIQVDRVVSTNKDNVSSTNSFVYVQPNIALNFDRNWSAKTQWRSQPNNVLTTRDPQYPERYRTFLSSDRKLFGLNEQMMLIEELKINYENDDMRFFAGKFDPTFGTAWRKTKRIGVFAAQFNEDYNLREKIGAGVSALLEDSQITFNTFFNDRTALSGSAIKNRGRASGGPGVAGNTNTPSSYSLSMEGKNFLGIENVFYNLGYRNLAVANSGDGHARETGYVMGAEYLYKIGRETSIIPMFEAVAIDNFSGIQGRNARYSTLALIGNYRSWTASTSLVTRDIKSGRSEIDSSASDNQVQFSIGYKFTDNLTLDISRANIKESGKTGSLLGATMSYIYKF